MSLEEKHRRLRELFLDHARVAVAFSGGVDSSLLLKVALDTLGAGNVMALHADSCLLSQTDRERVDGWAAANGFPGDILVRVPVLPLTWKPFVDNGPDRCYHCKRAIYREFLDLVERHGFAVLADGTNTDDLKARRPGLRAVRELGVTMPLVEAGLDKSEVRALAGQLGLSNRDTPSSSCLATRIPHGRPIDQELLTRIDSYEQGMAKLGFAHCRVRLSADDDSTVQIQLRETDFPLFTRPGMRVALVRYFQKNGINRVLLDLAGR